MKKQQKPDIIDWKLDYSMTVTTFLHVDHFLKLTGHNLNHMDKSAITCAHCESPHLIHMEYGSSNRKGEYSFTMCLCCFTVDSWEPVFEEVEESSNEA